MLEREMEDLIAANPDYFFPDRGSVLQGRQQSFRDVGRFDLLFADRHGWNILMELKAVPANMAVLDQVLRYKEALEALGSKKIWMWIVAPLIPRTIREFMDDHGIQYSEIHESDFNRAATLFGYMPPGSTERRDMPSQSEQLSSPYTFSESPVLTSTQEHLRDAEHTGNDEWGFGMSTQSSFLIRALEAGGKTKEEIGSEFDARFYPGLSSAEAKRRGGFGTFFSDSKRPVGTYHASRSLLIFRDTAGVLSLDKERVVIVKAAIAGGILNNLRGLHFQRDKGKFDKVLRSFSLKAEP